MEDLKHRSSSATARYGTGWSNAGSGNIIRDDISIIDIIDIIGNFRKGISGRM
ncbi:MAG: hypothetical protein N2V77_02805 [Canidatus Methanoxibalbensis ujae]|nr:hypothetical protein [Candidatus Methanoxibalbensis ujae]